MWLRLYSNGGWCGVRDTTCKRTPRGALASGYSFIFVFLVFFIVFTTPSPTLQKNIDIQTFPKLLMGIARDKPRSAAWVDVDETRRRGRGSNAS